MGYIVIVITLLLLVIFSIRKIRQIAIFQQPIDQEGYYLLVRKSEEAGKYYGVFQQGEFEGTFELSANLYVQLHAPVRGYLKVSEGKVRSFES